MTVTTSPLPPRRTLAGKERPGEAVWDGDRLLGQIERDEAGDWWARPPGGWFVPLPAAAFRADAVAFLERCDRLPSGWRHAAPGYRVPTSDELVKYVARLREGKPEDSPDG